MKAVSKGYSRLGQKLKRSNTNNDPKARTLTKAKEEFKRTFELRTAPDGIYRQVAIVTEMALGRVVAC